MQIETLGDAWNHSVKIQIWCAEGPGDGMKRKRDCWYNTTLDLETLLCTRGRDFPVGLLNTRLRCPRCGSRRIRVLFKIPTEEKRARATG